MKDLEKYSSEQLKKVNESLTGAEQSVFAAKGTGKDFIVDSGGNVTYRTNSLGYDRVLCGKEGNQKSYALGAGMLSVSPYESSYYDPDGFHQTKTGTALTGGNIGLFKFLADNTNVEWQGLFNGGEKASDYAPCCIRTIHEKGFCSPTPFLPGYDSTVHNHPGGGSQPSDLDTESKEQYPEAYENFGIYYGGDTFYFY